MTIFDLLFIAVFLLSAGMLVAAAVASARGRQPQGLKILRRLGFVLAAYFSVLILVSALTPQRFVATGADQCSDDWCIGVQSARRESTRDGLQYDVVLRLRSRARRAAQRERFVAVHLRDANGRQYAAEVDPHAVPFDTLLQPGETVAAARRFLVPGNVEVGGLVVTREGGGRFPGCCIIGDEASLFHRATIVRLDGR